MDERIAARILEKAHESYSRPDDIEALADMLGGADRDSVVMGIVAGRLYNAFYYQTRRILGRDPTPVEFEDFLEIVRGAVRKA